jgi:hypothetical protein
MLSGLNASSRARQIMLLAGSRWVHNREGFHCGCREPAEHHDNHLQILKLLAICWFWCFGCVSEISMGLQMLSLMTLAITTTTILPCVHAVSFQPDICDDYEITLNGWFSLWFKHLQILKLLAICCGPCWPNQYGHEIPQHISMTSKSVLILYLHAVYGIGDHTVTIPAPLQTVTSRNCHGFCGIIL